MAICNRDLDSTQQINTFNCSLGGNPAVTNTSAPGIITGQTYMLAIVPYQSQLASAMVSTMGVSGAPNLSLWVQRFIAGSGVTSMAVGGSLVATTFGTSGAQTFVIAGAGLTGLQAGDVLALSVAAANTAANNVVVTLALKALQDIRTTFGAS